MLFIIINPIIARLIEEHDKKKELGVERDGRVKIAKRKMAIIVVFVWVAVSLTLGRICQTPVHVPPDGESDEAHDVSGQRARLFWEDVVDPSEIADETHSSVMEIICIYS